MIRSLTKTALVLTLLTLILGAAAFAYGYAPKGLDKGAKLVARYTKVVWRRHGFLTHLLLVGTGCGVLGGALLAAGQAVGRARLSRGPQPRPGEERGLGVPIPQATSATAVDEGETLSMFDKIQSRVRRIAKATEPDIIRLVNEIVRGAVMLEASDVHLTSTRQGMDVSYRVDGVLEPVTQLPARLQAPTVARLRVMSRLDTTHHDVPQDGRMEVDKGGLKAELRVSILPTNHGPKVVMRVVRSQGQAKELAELGFAGAIQGQLFDMVERPQGMLFLTGPTGSGKTTTIYAALRYINEKRGEVTNIVTIEDPIELNLPFLTQTQVNEKVGLTFAKGLRSILRQDPNVIMVGEIRDSETSGIAVQAGLTGHLILTTVHTNSAAGVFNRLIETGVEPFLLASASLGSLSQRLVRRLCPHCAKLMPTTPTQAERLARVGVKVKRRRFYAPVGCERCGGRGYVGRTAIFELLSVSSRVREMINASVPTPELHDQAVKEGMATLIQDGLDKARTGQTSLDEVMRVAL